MGIVAPAALHAAAALLILLALSLIGFAAMPAAIRPRRAALSIPASLAIGMLAVGWVGWLAGTFAGTFTIVPLFIVATFVSLTRWRQWLRDVRRCGARIAMLARANVPATIALFIVVIACVPQLLLPLVDSDGLAYHVALPKLFLLTGHVWYVPWTFAGALPQALEMTYLVALRIAGGETAKFIHFGFFLAALATLALAVHRPRMRKAATIAPLFFAAAPVVLAPAAAAFTDHAAIFCILTAALLLFRRASPLLAGLALGAAIVTKVTAAPAVAGLIIFGVWGRRPRRPSGAPAPPGAAALHGLTLIAPVIVAFLPFGIRNVVHTGDPIFPISYILLHRAVPGIPPERVAYAAYFHSRVPGPLGIAWMPDPEHAQPDEVAGLHHVIGLFALALTIWFPRTRRWLAIVLPPLAVAVLFHPPTRLLLPMFAGLAALEACALVVLTRKIASLIAVAAATPAAITSIALMLTAFHPADYLLGRMTRDQFLATRLPGFAAAQIVNRQPPGGWVMALDFPVPYYFDRPWIAEGMLNEPPLRLWIANAKSAHDVLARLRGADVRYLIVTPGYGGGTRAALLPLASNPREAAIVIALRRDFTLLGSIAHNDVLELSN